MDMLSNEKVNFKSLEENTLKKSIYLLDELLEINDFGLYLQGIVEMVTGEITKKSYRETAKTISHTAVRI